MYIKSILPLQMHNLLRRYLFLILKFSFRILNLGGCDTVISVWNLITYLSYLFSVFSDDDKTEVYSIPVMWFCLYCKQNLIKTNTYMAYIHVGGYVIGLVIFTVGNDRILFSF